MNHWESSNPFYWDTIKLNLPGAADYDPRRPRLEKVAGISGKLAPLIVSYVDDMRAAGNTADECWGIMHQVASRASFLGIQVVTRKTRPLAKDPGPWSGSTVVTDENGIGVRAMLDKWNKVKLMLEQTLQQVEAGQQLDRKTLESDRGTLVYLQRTYPAITPYVKGYRLTIDAWRPNRDAEGWRTNTLPSAPTPSSPPELVTPVPRHVDDLRALSSLFSAPEPPLWFIRSNAILETVYGFSDASGAGFGSTFTHGQDVHYCHGIWIDDEAMETSNYRELANLVNTLETGHNSEQFKHAEVWFFTDNTTAEGVFWRGHSPSRKLNELALRLRILAAVFWNHYSALCRSCKA